METNPWHEPPTGRGNAHACSVLIAVKPDSFQRLIEHVLNWHPGLRVVGAPSKEVSAADRAARHEPDVIIASTRLRRTERGDVLADLKRSSPASTLILLTHGLSEWADKPEVDAWLPEDAVVRRLLPVIRKAVLERTRERASQAAPQGRRS